MLVTIKTGRVILCQQWYTPQACCCVSHDGYRKSLLVSIINMLTALARNGGVRVEPPRMHEVRRAQLPAQEVPWRKTCEVPLPRVSKGLRKADTQGQLDRQQFLFLLRLHALTFEAVVFICHPLSFSSLNLKILVWGFLGSQISCFIVLEAQERTHFGCKEV